MKAIIATAYGTPDVYQLTEQPKPKPNDDEILVKIHAASLTPADSAFRKGDPFIIRLMYGLRKPRLAIPGVEFAGIVEAIGKDVTKFKVGDAIFGASPNTFGAHAEYVAVPEKAPLALKPDNISYEEIVGVLDGAATARTFLVDVAKIQAGQRVLINGASGAVGAYGVQIAKHLGAHVTGVCSYRNTDLVQSLGADAVIDYTKEDFTNNGATYDVIFDAVGKSSYGRCKDSLTPNGTYLTTVPSFEIIGAFISTTLFGSKSAKFVAAGLMQSHDTLNELKTMVESGILKPVIDRCYPLEDIIEAHHYVDTERKRGNVVIQIAQGI